MTGGFSRVAGPREGYITDNFPRARQASWLSYPAPASAKLDSKYPAGPLLLRLPFRNQALVLRPDQLHRVLAESPEPFSPATSEKRGALAHFKPRNVLVSTGTERTVRRALQEQALDTSSPVHRFADSFLPVI